MKADRKLSLYEVLSGKISQEYLDLKEKVAVVKRHIRKLATERDDLRDKIEVLEESGGDAGKISQAKSKLDKVLSKIDKLMAELEDLERRL